MMADKVSPALQALLAGLIDYAGTFPPAMLSRDAAVRNYKSYRDSEHGWMLRWLVIGAAEVEQVPRELDGALAVLSDVDNNRAAVLETKSIIASARPAYCEVPIRDLDRVQSAGCFAKLRTGSVKPELIPTVEDVAAYILTCADRRLPFKATAGLHHPVRAVHPLTYEADAPRATMHGFLNVFLAAAFAWQGQRAIEPILAETDAAAFRFDERAHWRGWSLGPEQVRDARTQFAHSFGSCSFEEPVQDLKALGLL
jgi:hypothetical protein